jgi:AcrR family transcriptional regulator
MASDSEGFQRRRPKQSRSRATCDAILEAASQILERDGPAGFNTASVAERAGVSIGTLYQYFPDKQAILLAAAQREMGREAAPGRQTVFLRALIDWLEQVGRQASAAPAKPRLATVRTLRRRRLDLERRVAGWVDAGGLVLEQLLLDIALVPRPVPIPIRVKRRR